jgi:hypothetical protein
MPKGLRMNEVIYDCLEGFQWLLIIAALCVMCSDNPKKRRYETVLLEIARKNGKTFIIAVLFILLFLLEPKFSYFYSVAPDGALSREIKKALEEIIKFSQLAYVQDQKMWRLYLRPERIIRDMLSDVDTGEIDGSFAITGVFGTESETIRWEVEITKGGMSNTELGVVSLDKLFAI